MTVTDKTNQFKYRIAAKVVGEKISYSVSNEGLTRKLIYALGYPDKETAQKDADSLTEINPGITFTVVPW